MAAPDHESRASQNARVIGSAAARLISRKWACPDCAGVYGCRSSARSCEMCSPPRNPVPRRSLDEDNL